MHRILNRGLTKKIRPYNKRNKILSNSMYTNLKAFFTQISQGEKLKNAKFHGLSEFEKLEVERFTYIRKQNYLP